jgi:hypothetical protein
MTVIFSFQVNVSQSRQKTQFDRKIALNYLKVFTRNVQNGH